MKGPILVVLTVILIGSMISFELMEDRRAMDNCIILHSGTETRQINRDWYCRTADKQWINMGKLK